MSIKKLGKFIVLEGIEGAGKTSSISGIMDYLKDCGIKAVRTRQPGGTEIAEKLRDCLLGHYDESYSSKAELLTVFAARAQFLENFVYPNLSKGVWVICDRFTDSTYAYQGRGRGCPFSDIRQVEDLVQGVFRPNLVFVLDLDPRTGIERTKCRDSNKKQDRMNCESLAFYKRCRELFLERALADPFSYQVINAMQPPQAVQQDLRRHIKELF